MDNFCKICFKKIGDFSLYNFIRKNNILCESCFSKFNAKFINFKIGGVKGTSIYEYSDYLKELMYKFKGCFDYELKDVFLFRYLSYLKLKYYGYYLVCAPSFHIDDEKRGFNHVRAIFQALKLKELNILKKKMAYKQSDQSFKSRKNIKDIIEIDKNTSLKDKKILLVDDIMTTGSTLLTCVELLRKHCARKIEILVIAKTKNKKKEEY